MGFVTYGHYQSAEPLDTNKLHAYYNNKKTDQLAVKNGSLVLVKKNDITLWNKFISLFGKGALADTDCSLKGLNAYLISHTDDIRELKENHGDDEAYKGVCIVANKIFVKNPKNYEVFQAVSTKQKFDIKLTQLDFRVIADNQPYILKQTVHAKQIPLSIDHPEQITQIDLYVNPMQNSDVLFKQMREHLSEIKKTFKDKIKSLCEGRVNTPETEKNIENILLARAHNVVLNKEKSENQIECVIFRNNWQNWASSVIAQRPWKMSYRGHITVQPSPNEKK